MKKETYIDDVINNNLHKEIRFFLDKDLKEEDYKLSILMQNYYTLSDKRYIESIKKNIYDRYPDNIPDIPLDRFRKFFYITSIVGGAFTSNPFLLYFGIAGICIEKVGNKLKEKKILFNYLYGQKLKELELDRWEKVLNMYKKEYIKIIK